MIDVLVHAGFYKTGTTTLQQTLRLNRQRLAGHVACYLQEDLGPASDLGRIWGERGGCHRRWRFRMSVRRFLRAVPAERRILISRESFCGAMVGTPRARRPVLSYLPAAIPLARVLRSEIGRRFGPAAQVRFAYTTRDRTSLIRSLWGHHVRAADLALPARAFTEAIPDRFDLEREAAAIATALAPTPVATLPLAAARHRRLGPADPLLDLLDLPEALRDRLVPAEAANVALPDAMLEEFRDLNASVGDPGRLRAIKRARRDAYLGGTDG